MNAEREIQPIPKLLTDESSKYKGPGWQLRTAREAAQTGIGDVARQLRLSVDTIAAIERDDYSHMAGLTFIRGYLRSYARLLNLPGDDILIAFDRLGIPEKVPQIPLNIYGAKQTTISDSTIRSIAYAVFAILVILAAVWWHSQSSSSNAAPKNAPAPAAAPQKVSAAAAAASQAPTATANPIQKPDPVVQSSTDAISTATQQPRKTPAQTKQTVVLDNQQRVTDETADEEVKPRVKVRGKARRRVLNDEEDTSYNARTRVSEPASSDGESD